MARLDLERQKRLEPTRMQYAIAELNKIGIVPFYSGETDLKFNFENEVITFFPYSGWHTGKTITDGRGFKKLFKQIT